MGLLAVVSLPRAFVFRLDIADPHPAPWIRVKLSCAMGRELYPHPQWGKLAELWESFYPMAGLTEHKRELFSAMEKSIPRFVAVLVNHRPEKLRGKSLIEVLAAEGANPRAWPLTTNSGVHLRNKCVRVTTEFGVRCDRSSSVPTDVSPPKKRAAR